MPRKPKLRKIKPVKNCKSCNVPKSFLFGIVADFSNCPHEEVLKTNREKLTREYAPAKIREEAIEFVETHVCAHWGKGENND